MTPGGTQAVGAGARNNTRRPRRLGMTLVEILIVLAIVGVAAGAVVLSLGSLDRDTGAQLEANRLADRLRLASDHVLVSGRPLIFVWSSDGYAFEGSDDLTDALRQRHPLPSGIRLAGPSGAENMVIDPDSAAQVQTFAFRKGEKAWTVDFDGLNAVTRAAVASGKIP